MNSLTKKIAIYSLTGIMQVGFGAAVIEASPLHNDVPQQIVQLDNRHHHDNGRHREHAERQRRENERHEREMRRRHNESVREWHHRQEIERHRHDNAMREIAAFLIGIAVGSSNN
jgi:hypothetical protein